MVRIVLASSLMGKTYTNSMYSNVYDFDQHTLAHKYNREDYPHLTDEQFKGLPGRIIKNNWLPGYLDAFTQLIDTTSCDVVLGWLQKDVVDGLLARGYTPELVFYSPTVDTGVLYQRGVARGNTYPDAGPVTAMGEKIYATFTTGDYPARCGGVWVADEPIYLNEFLVSTGTQLTRNNGEPDIGVRDVTTTLRLLPGTER